MASTERSEIEDSVALLGGTGRLGFGLGLRLARSGLRVRVGSRDAARAVEAASRLGARLPDGGVAAGLVSGHSNSEAVRDARVVIVTVPYAGLVETLEDVREAVVDRIVVSAVVPLGRDAAGVLTLLTLDSGSAAELVGQTLPRARVAAGFHSVSSALLTGDGDRVDGDVIVTADDEEAKEVVMGLVMRIPALRGVDGGGLRNSRHTEGVAALLLGINRIYRTHAGIAVTNLPPTAVAA